MSKYRFIGTLKECGHSSSNKVLRFVPDQECAVIENCGDNKVKYVVLLPCNSGEGVVFKYMDKLEIVDTGKSAWLSSWKAGGHYELVIVSTKKASREVEVLAAPKTKYFKLESVTEKA